MFRWSRLKNPSWLENWYWVVCFVGVSVADLFEISSARINPIIVIEMAMSLIDVGIVIWMVFVGKMAVVISRPEISVPKARRIMGLVWAFVFSLILARGLCRENFICT